MIDFEKENIKKLENYFISGCKKESNGFSLGLELEHFIVHKGNKKTVSFYGEKGVAEVLKKISKYYQQVEKYDGYVVGLEREGIAITIEPAAQIEVSISPKESIQEIFKVYQGFRDEIATILERWEYCLVESGYHPKTKIDEIPLIPKKRYQYMDQYFRKIGTNGKYMMKGTASVQVSIDYFSEKDFAQKYTAAYQLLPLLCLITDNSPIFEGESYQGYLLRARIWEEVDQERVDVLTYFKQKEFTFEEYAKYVYQVPLILYEKQEEVIPTDQSAKRIYKNKLMDFDEIEHVLSMVFPDVRLKKYVEIRYADSMPIQWVLSYLALIKGLFIRMEKLTQWMDDLGVEDFEDMVEGKHEIMLKGLEGRIYKRPVMDLLNELFALAQENLEGDESEYLRVLKKQILEKKILIKNLL